MRTHVTFRHPAPFVPVSEDDGVMSVKGADWFVSLLSRIADIHLQEDLCQEDWGVVVFAERAGKKFWIGLSAEEEGAWLAHVHHDSWAFFQRLSASGERELQRLARDIHDALAGEAAISAITWYREDDSANERQHGSATPNNA